MDLALTELNHHEILDLVALRIDDKLKSVILPKRIDLFLDVVEQSKVQILVVIQQRVSTEEALEQSMQ